MWATNTEVHQAARTLNSLALDLQELGHRRQASDTFRAALVLLKHVAAKHPLNKYTTDDLLRRLAEAMRQIEQAELSQGKRCQRVHRFQDNVTPREAVNVLRAHLQSPVRTALELTDRDRDLRTDSVIVLLNYSSSSPVQEQRLLSAAETVFTAEQLETTRGLMVAALVQARLLARATAEERTRRRVVLQRLLVNLAGRAAPSVAEANLLTEVSTAAAAA